MRKCIIAFLLIVFVILPCIVMAQTSEWLAQNKEDVCGRTKGAGFGLCNAYCKAMKCSNETSEASPTACAKVADLYKEFTGNVSLPCDLACPCNESGSNFANLLLSVDDSMSCFEYDGIVSIKDPLYGGGMIGASVPDCVCFYVDFQVTEVQEITPKQADACIAILHEKIDAAGLTCSEIPGPIPGPCPYPPCPGYP